MKKDIEVLVSTMNSKEPVELIKKMNVTGKSLIINQITNKEAEDILIDSGANRVFSYHEKGLSRSRNKALKNSLGDICVIADDDVEYVENYENIIKYAYDEYKDADIIAFYVEGKNGEKFVTKQKAGKIDLLHTMKLCSVQLTFKRESIVGKNIEFDEKFGTGSGMFRMGEENIFLMDCIRQGIKIYFKPIKIATVDLGDSTWFNGYNEEFFISRGASFYRMSASMSMIFILQFAIRKYKLYKNEMSFIKSIKYMLKGVKKIKKGE